MNTETITWHPPGESMPDAEIVVLVSIEGGNEPVWLGYWTGAEWRDVEGPPIAVTAWADVPAGWKPQ